jgi:hypothetical protein
MLIGEYMDEKAIGKKQVTQLIVKLTTFQYTRVFMLSGHTDV